MRTLLLLAMTVLSGCATAKEIAALRQVDFRFDGVSNPRLAGVPLERIRSYDDLSAADLARLGIAVAAKDVPIDLTVTIEGTNPVENDVTARLLALDWAYLVDDREAVSGQVTQAYSFPPGQPTDVPLRVSFDLIDFFGGSSRDLLEVALALAGQGSASHRVTMRIAPTVDTPVGPIRYPVPITLDVSGNPSR